MVPNSKILKKKSKAIAYYKSKFINKNNTFKLARNISAVNII